MQDNMVTVRPLSLIGRRVDVWPVRLEANASVVAWLHSILASDEAERAAQFRFEHLRRSFILARGALRVLLGRYLGIAPEEVRFSYGSKGKPGLAWPTSTIKFNASHSGVFALFAFTRDCELGVDVEQIRSFQDMQEIANRFFCAEEAEELMSLPAELRARAFFLCWTSKEAYIKAVGEGLSVPLDSFRVTLRPGEPARLIHLAHDTTAAAAWTLHRIELTSQYAATLAYNDSPRPVRALPAIWPSELSDIA